MTYRRGMTIFNRSDMLERRRRLRRRPTPQEKALYEALRGRQLLGYKFRFQASIGHYVVDFYCPKLKLAVELDGHQHATVEGQAYDAVRTAFLASLGVHVLRFPNRQIDEDLPGVLASIERHVWAVTSPSM